MSTHTIVFDFAARTTAGTVLEGTNGAKGIFEEVFKGELQKRKGCSSP